LVRLTKEYSGDKVKKRMVWVDHEAYMVGKSEGKTQLGKRCRIGDYNIKWNLEKSNGMLQTGFI
jgi:hypothetical protein